MTLARREKAFVAVFAVGLAALMADRVFLRPQGGAEQASADAFAKYGVPPSGAEKTPPIPTEAETPSVAARLARAWPDGEPNLARVRDPFSLKDSWLGSTEENPSAVPDPAATFAKTHTLGAVVMNGPESHILIGDRFLTVGRQIDGFTLISIGPKSAVFERQGERIVLELVNE